MYITTFTFITTTIEVRICAYVTRHQNKAKHNRNVAERHSYAVRGTKMATVRNFVVKTEKYIATRVYNTGNQGGKQITALHV